MRILKAVVLGTMVFALVTFVACGASYSSRDAGEQAPSNTQSAPEEQPASGSLRSTAKQGGAAPDDATFVKASTVQTVQPTVERKIIRNAALTVEIDSPDEAQRRIASITEARGGFVVTSESRQHGGGGDADGAKAYQTVTIEIRIPAAQFDAVIGEIRSAGGRVRDEKITGQDVTEEYIDLEARIRTKKALEEQFLEIMKQARTVADALQVQTQIAEVRGEIERLEGRRRFLENQTSLSTIKVTLQPPVSFVNTNATGFFAGVKEAFGDGIDLAATFILVLIRLVIVLIPVFLFLVLPITLLIRYLLRRLRRRQRPPLPLGDDKPLAAETRV